MKNNSPSRTAQGAALHRAAHQLLDHPQIFKDPLALKIIGPEALVALTSSEADRSENSSRGLRAFIAVRSRLAEDALNAAIGRGVRQYILLGAGLDTFAYRAAHQYPGLSVFEVDHPATQNWKRERLTESGIEMPSTLTYAPIDFENEFLDQGLARVGFDRSVPAFFAWLGVVPYLTSHAIMSTLRFIASGPRGSEVIFDYGEPPSERNAAARAAYQAMSDRVTQSGEPFRSFFMPEDLMRDVSALGFSHVEDFDAAVLNPRYFSNRSDGLKLSGSGHLLLAHV